MDTAPLCGSPDPAAAAAALSNRRCCDCCSARGRICERRRGGEEQRKTGTSTTHDERMGEWTSEPLPIHSGPRKRKKKERFLHTSQTNEHPTWDTQTSTFILSQHIDRFVTADILAPSMAAPSGDPFVFLFFLLFVWLQPSAVGSASPLRESWAALLLLVVCCCWLCVCWCECAGRRFD